MLNYKIYSADGTISLEKPVLVFIHGLGGSSATWIKQVRKFKNKYDLLLIDLPSHGKNNVLLSELQTSYQAVADKIIEVLDYLHIKTATFIGCSVGTIFVKYLVLKYPEVVKKYILIGGVGDLQNWFKFGIKLAKMSLFFLPTKFCYSAVGRIIIPKKEYEEGRELFIQCAKRIPREEMSAWLSLLAQFPALNREYMKKLKEIDNGLYITGEDDNLFLPMLEKELIQTRHKSLIKDCGHLCNIDKPDEVNELIDEFLTA
jgi:pimeloyl-ACP methyl ester carboxylesterase